MPPVFQFFDIFQLIGVTDPPQFDRRIRMKMTDQSG
jgi:hypothetical protein